MFVYSYLTAFLFILTAVASQDITCGTNEIVNDCPAYCQSDFCPKCNVPLPSCTIPDPCPPPACKCIFNYRRADNGTCIPTRECPPFECPKNEVYDPCPPLCPGEKCADAKLNGICPFRIGIVLICNPTCRCKPHYFRNSKGVCVPVRECDDNESD